MALEQSQKKKSKPQKVVKPTTQKNPEEWYHVDASGKTLGRLASQVATVLRGKNRRDFTPHILQGNCVVVTNAEKILVSAKEKTYYRYTGYFGGLKETSLQEMRQKHPERIIQFAVKGMLPKNRLQARFLKKLKVYKGASHPHLAQNPKPLEFKFHA